MRTISYIPNSLLYVYDNKLYVAHNNSCVCLYIATIYNYILATYWAHVHSHAHGLVIRT